MADVINVGDVALHCTRDGWVFLMPLCRRFRLDYHIWRDRLGSHHNRGRIQFRYGPEGDGSYDKAQVHYQDVAVWLQEVPPAYLSYLEREEPDTFAAMQIVRREGAEAIRRHFFGIRRPDQPAPPIAGPDPPSIDRQIAAARQLLQALETISAQQQQIDALESRVRGNTELSLRAVELQTLGGRCDGFQVRTCCAHWGLPTDEDSVRPLGVAVRKAAEREGWLGDRHRDFDSQYPRINRWPARRILRWFTDRYGPCPVAELRDLLAAEEAAS